MSNPKLEESIFEIAHDESVSSQLPTPSNTDLNTEKTQSATKKKEKTNKQRSHLNYVRRLTNTINTKHCFSYTECTRPDI